MSYLKHDHARFYNPARDLPLGAGVLIRDCVVALPHLTETRFETGLGLALVLTHECDLDHNNDRYFNNLVLVCPVIPLDDFCEECEQEDGRGAWGGILPQIASDRVYRAMYLPPLFNFSAVRIPTLCPEMEGGGIVYLNHMSSCRVEWIRSPVEQAICSLSAVGLRAFDFKLQNHLFREKEASLWFHR